MWHLLTQVSEAFFSDVPDAVWTCQLSGYPTLKKWLGYRQADRPDKPLTDDKRKWFRQIVQRIAALLALGADLDALYQKAASMPSLRRSWIFRGDFYFLARGLSRPSRALPKIVGFSVGLTAHCQTLILIISNRCYFSSTPATAPIKSSPSLRMEPIGSTPGGGRSPLGMQNTGTP